MLLAVAGSLADVTPLIAVGFIGAAALGLTGPAPEGA
jgi:hypothetical protein